MSYIKNDLGLKINKINKNASVKSMSYWGSTKDVQNIKLFIADDLHLIGSKHNGTTLEVVCCRTSYMSFKLKTPIRIIRLS